MVLNGFNNVLLLKMDPSLPLVIK